MPASFQSTSEGKSPMMSLGVQIVLFMLGVAVVGTYAWHIFNATESDWQEAKSDDPKKERKE